MARLPLIGWAVCTVVALFGFFLYAGASTDPANAAFSERPWAWEAVVVACAIASVLLPRRLGWTGDLRRATVPASVGAALMATFLVAYVHAYSFTLPDGAPPAVGDVAPALEVTDPEGRTTSLAAHRGEDVLVVFYRGHW